MDNRKNNQIFYAKTPYRWHITIALIITLILATLLLWGNLIYSIRNHPNFTSFKISNLSLNDNHKENNPTPLNIPTRLPVIKNSIAKAGVKKPKILAYYVNWDEKSFMSLRKNIETIDQLIPEWFHLNNDGQITLNNQQIQDKTLEFIKLKKPDLKITPLINNYNPKSGNWDTQILKKITQDTNIRRQVIDNLSLQVQKYHFSGINIDFELISSDTEKSLNIFIKELYDKFHPLGLEVIYNITFGDENFDLVTLEKYSDLIAIMAFGEHLPSQKQPGPIASQRWFEKNLKKELSGIPTDKYVIVLGNFGYDWPQEKTPVNQLSHQEILTGAKRKNLNIIFDKASLNSTYNYYDNQGILHYVWFLDGITAFNQIKFANTFKPYGFALWRLGSEDSSIWEVIKKRDALNRKSIDSLTDINYINNLVYEGEGEIYEITETKKAGYRNLYYNNEYGLIDYQNIIEYPSPYTVFRSGKSINKKIVLTFDDGPDTRFTPKILDILKEQKVPATFFVSGIDALGKPALIKRVYQEGHEIGSHTFSHPNIEKISFERLNYELNTTQRILEGIIGHNTIIFRPPYGEGIEPENINEVKPLIVTSSLGYKTIGMQIDPLDWKNKDPDSIVSNIVSDSSSLKGNIVLLHDGGGNRSNTVLALPKIISELKNKGFEFVSVANLAGITKDQLMPPVTTTDTLIAKTNKISFKIFGLLTKTFASVFFTGIIIGIFRSLLIIILAIIQWIKTRYRRYNKIFKDYSPFASVIVPAYNEEKVICKTINSLIKNTYKNFEIIIVNDGSKDNTCKIVKKTYRRNPKIRIFSIPNGGKANALNFGLSKSIGKIIIALDADTIFNPSTIARLIRHFKNPKIGAVAGNVKVGNRINILTRIQALEYIISQNLDRRAFCILNCIPVVPGAVGAWRKKAIKMVGGFSTQTMAEDADLTFSIISKGYKVLYDDSAKAYTEAPDNITNFLKQRFRWMFGILQTAWKHRKITFNPKYGLLGFVTIPNIYIFQLFFTLILPILDLAMILSFLWAGWQKINHPLEYSAFANIKYILIYYLLFLTIEFSCSLLAFLFEYRENKKLLFWIIPQRFFYRQLLCFVAFKTLFAAIKGRFVKWNKLERKATVLQAEKEVTPMGSTIES